MAIQNAPKQPPSAQKTYRRNQRNKGLVRYELQVNAKTKALFEEMVNTLAQEHGPSYGARRRQAKARVEIFDQLVQGIVPQFNGLQEEITQLKKEIQALSPSFFAQKNDAAASPLPEAIRSLPDDVQQLKTILANTWQQAQLAHRAALQHQQNAERYQKLFEAASEYNEELQQKIQSVS